MKFLDRYRKSHHGYSPLAIFLVIPLLTLVIPLIALISGMSDTGSAWGRMLVVWGLLLAFVYLVYVPFIAPREKRRREAESSSVTTRR